MEDVDFIIFINIIIQYPSLLESSCWSQGSNYMQSESLSPPPAPHPPQFRIQSPPPPTPHTPVCREEIKKKRKKKVCIQSMEGNVRREEEEEVHTKYPPKETCAEGKGYSLADHPVVMVFLGCQKSLVLSTTYFLYL